MSKLKICDGCHFPKVIWKNVIEEGERRKLCKECWSCHSSHSRKPTKVKKPIAPRSHKRKAQEKDYSSKRKIFMAEHPMCQANIPGLCTSQSTDIHHVKGRIGELLLDETHWMSVCRACHMYIETHPIEATELGFRKSKTL
jgi:hypothetical protein